MKIGIVGYPQSGKSTLFEWLTGIAPDPALAHTSQTAMAVIPESRVKPLCDVYHPKKITLASLELVDTPGLSRTHEGNAGRLAVIREAGCLVLVAAAFEGGSPTSEINRFEEDLLLADLEIVTRRIDRLEELIKKPRPSRDQDRAEMEALRPLMASLESGKRVPRGEMSEEQVRATRSFQLLTEKPSLVVVNTADDEENPARFVAGAGRPLVAVPLRLELELSRMTPEERSEFVREMGLTTFDRDGLIRAILDASEQMLFFTAGDKEVRTWLIRRGGTALEAADGIHTDLARGFIRCETMTCDDLIRLGSEREVKAQGLMRQEHKDYVIRDGDILHIRHNA